VPSKDLIKSSMGDITNQIRDEDILIFDVLMDDTIREKKLEELFENHIVPFTNKTLTKAGIKKLAEQKVENQKVLAAQAKEKYETANNDLLKTFAEYNVTTIENLKNCLDLWNENKKNTEDLNSEITTLKNEIELKNSNLENNTQLLDEKKTEKKNIETEKQNFVVQRTEFFGNRKADAEENRLKNTVLKAETEKNLLEETRNNINTELAKNKAVIVEKQKELMTKQVENITEKSQGELQEEYCEKKEKSDEFSQKIGANKQILISNIENIEKNGKKLSEKEAQKKNCNKWDSLNELIGSSEGNKYRNFVQALTFEHLIGLANRQLQKMSERYVLKRVGDAFDLAVIDKFQNYDERTAKNLSGGEKFIVSLSLALGLSSMASRSMRIDTMFIDEGFGTLDSDYLDVALSALSNLQNEGKLIGVISHLAELKERIATHIEVTPRGNGHSQIAII
jgi:exonuclease SbcC